MSKNLIYDDNYYYFIHGTTFDKLRHSRGGLFSSPFEPIPSESATILMNEIFENGLISRDESICYMSIMIPNFKEDKYPVLPNADYIQQLDLKEHNKYSYVENCLKIYQTDKYTKGYNFLIKIPKEYFNIKYLDNTFPMWRGTKQKDLKGKRISYLDPHFIVGMYDTTNKVFISNTEYNPVFDPSGLLFNSDILCCSSETQRKEYYELLELRRKLFDGDKLLKFDQYYDNYESRIKELIVEDKYNSTKNKLKIMIKKLKQQIK